MKCNKCENEVTEGTKFCPFCGNDLTINSNKEIKPVSTSTSDNLELYKILSYIGILWLVGLIADGGKDKDLKFHIGQGMILTVFTVALYIVIGMVNSLLIYNLFRTEVSYFGITRVSGFGLFIASILNLAIWIITVVYAIKGIINVTQNKQENLPVIGKYAFYK